MMKFATHTEKNEFGAGSVLPFEYVPTRAEGLTAAEVQKRKEEGLGNEASIDRGKSFTGILAENTLSLFNLINFALAVCLFLVRSYRNMLFMGVVVSNIFIGVVQELRARNTLRRLRILNAPVSHVIRDARESECRAGELVFGDLIVLRAGDQVPADAVVTFGSGAADESLLTGERDPMLKMPGSVLFSGSFITEGKLTAQLVRVGEDSYAACLTREARSIRRPKSALMTDLNRLVRLVSMILFPLGILLFVKQIFLSHSFLPDTVTSTAAAMIGMIPEGLILLTSVALAVGVIRLGRRNALVQELYGIETLARVDLLCLDKTGTITTGRMKLKELIALDCDEASLQTAIARYLGAFDDPSPTLDAIRAAVPPLKESPVAVLPFSSTRKKSAATFLSRRTLIFGAPGFVLDPRRIPAEVRSLTDLRTGESCRVLMLAEAEGEICGECLPEASKLLGLIVLEEEIRPHAAETLQYFRDQGVLVKIISGDDPQTASRIAAAAGVEGADRWIDLSNIADDELPTICEDAVVFGRVTPAQKRKLMEAMKAAGHSVAMVGDGVNDIPAMKSADCSIAIASGSDAARHAAQLTLLDSDFSALPEIVLEGRRVINNITRSASLFLTKTLFSFALSVLLLFLPGTYPFQPIQLTLISALTIGFPSFVLALEPNRERIRGDFLRNVLSAAIPGAAADTICAALSMCAGYAFGWSAPVCSALATVSAGFVGLLILLRACLPLNRLRAALILSMSLAFFCGVTFFRDLFRLEGLTAAHLPLLLLLFVIGGMIVIILPRTLTRKEKTP